ncbi:MAG: prolipoprotein diacylglyceryl transferase [Firmicutes bacterium]|nr:prolipoprotein diacylglyceryl transferase [Bacillota bacterium]
MNPVALRVGLITVYWYGIMAALAMLTGYLVARRFAVSYGIDPDRFDSLMLLYIPTIIVGARAAYVIAKWDFFRDNLIEIVKTYHGGLGSHGAIIAMVIVGWISTRLTRVPFWTLADAIAPAVPLAHVFVRLGNFFNGELYGLPTGLPWGMVFPGTFEPRHPSMLYEGIVSVFTFALSYYLARRRIAEGRAREGRVFLKTMFLVSVVRLLVDFTRPRGRGVFLGLMLTQVLALAIALVCAALLALPVLPGAASAPGSGDAGHSVVGNGDGRRSGGDAPSAGGAGGDDDDAAGCVR